MLPRQGVVVLDVADLATWNPVALDELAAELERCGRTLDTVGEDMHVLAVFEGRWHGEAHRAADRELRGRADDCVAQAESYRRARSVAVHVAARLRELHAELGELTQWAAARGLAVDAAALAVPDAASDAETLRTNVQHLVYRAAALDREAGALLARELGDMPTGLSHTANRLMPLSVPRAALLPEPGSPPAEVARWWNTLDDTARTALLAEHPDRIGALDGVPATVRDLANRELLDVERRRLDDVAAQLRAQLDGMWLGDTVLGRVGVTGWFTDADAGLEQTSKKIAALDAIDETLARGDRQLLALDLTGREAMAAVAVGDVDTADRVAVFVPGAGSTVQGNLAGYDSEIAALRESAQHHISDDGHGTAVASVTWLNYQAPQWGWGLAFTERSPVSDLAARIAAPRLTDFLDGIVESRSIEPRTDPPTVTTVGHSYGALVTGLALQTTGSADAAVFLGAPGIGTGDVSELRIPPGAAYLVEADCDPVADAGTFGGDPSFLDGLTRLPSEAGTTPDGRPLDENTGHSSYLRPGTSSAHHVSGVVAGLPERSSL